MAVRPISLQVLSPTALRQANLTGAALSLPHGIVDSMARRIRYVRISVTDRCNYRCSYCMPDSDASGVEFGARSELLSFEEIERITNSRHQTPD